VGRLFHLLPQIRGPSTSCPQTHHHIPCRKRLLPSPHAPVEDCKNSSKSSWIVQQLPFLHFLPVPTHNPVVSWSRHWGQVPLNGLDFFCMPCELPVQLWTQLHYRSADAPFLNGFLGTAIEPKRNGPNLGENSRRKGGSSEWMVQAIGINLGKTDLSSGGIGQAGSRRQEEAILTD
jgi:hypothetical protein